MIRQVINKELATALRQLKSKGSLGDFDLKTLTAKNLVEACKDRTHGDYASNMGMRMAGMVKKNPMEISQIISDQISAQPAFKKFFSKIEVAAPGFINFTVAPQYLYSETAQILKDGNEYGCVDTGKKIKTQVEFVSANPTAMMHVGNGRSAIYGDALSNVLAKAGYDVEREYYINDAKVSHQVQELGKTALGQGISYMTPYLEALMKKLHPRLSKFRSQTDAGFFLAGEVMKDLKKFITKDLGIKFDNWVSEESLYKQSLIIKTYDWLKKKGLVFEKDDAYWLNLSKYNQKDEVLLRKDGSPTYFLSDIAYHKSKIDRKYKKIIDIWGADHQGHVPRMKAVMKLIGYKGEFEVLICQIVNLNGAKLSKRTGNIVSMEWLVKEVGIDAARFFYLQNSLSSQMDFNVDLAKKKSSDSPVFYVQYAHARIASILRKAKIKKVSAGPEVFKTLQHPSELELMKELMRLPEVVEDAAKDYQVQRLCLYSTTLATAFHKFYCDCQVISEDIELTKARLALVSAAKITLKNTLAILGISAPEKM